MQLGKTTLILKRME